MKSTELKNDLQNIEKYQEARKQEYDDSLYVCVYLTFVRCEFKKRRRKGKKGVARRERKRSHEFSDATKVILLSFSNITTGHSP